MGYYEVKQDEQLQEIFLRERGRIDIEAVLDDPKNAALFESRSALVLRPGDKLWLPDDPPTLREETVAAGGLHRFQLRGLVRDLELVLKAPDGTPLADAEYTLVLGDRSYSGTTDGNGLLSKRVPTREHQGTLTVGNYVWPLRVGGLEPAHTVRGIQGRLYNLGYAPGAIDGEAGTRTATAVRAFQGDCGLEETGQVDDETRAALVDACGL